MTTTPLGDTIRAALADLEAQAARPSLPAWLAPSATPRAPAADDTSPRAALARAEMARACARLAMELGDAASATPRPDPVAVGDLVRQLVRQALAVGVACGWAADGVDLQGGPPPAAVARVIAVLDDAMTPTQISSAVGLSRSRVAMLLTQGREGGWIERVGYGKYALTRRGASARRGVAAPATEADQDEEPEPAAEHTPTPSPSPDDFDLGGPVRIPPSFPGRPMATPEHVITVCGLPVHLRRVREHDAEGWRVTLPDGRSDWKPCRDSSARWAQRMISDTHQEAAA